MLKQGKRPWSVLLDLSPGAVQLLVTEPQGDVLKAQFATQPGHSRALTLILRGLAHWHGSPLSVVTFVDHPVDHSFGLGPFGDVWLEETALLRFEFVETDFELQHGVHITGVGNFTRLHRIQRWGGRP